IINLYVSANNPSSLLQSLHQSCDLDCSFRVVLRYVHEYADPADLFRLLRTHGRRPNGCRSRDSIDEIAAPHCRPPGSKQGIVAGQTGGLEVVKAALSNVRFGSIADICSAKRHVRFTPKSGYQLSEVGCA